MDRNTKKTAADALAKVGNDHSERIADMCRTTHAIHGVRAADALYAVAVLDSTLGDLAVVFSMPTDIPGEVANEIMDSFGSVRALLCERLFKQSDFTPQLSSDLAGMARKLHQGHGKEMAAALARVMNMND
jgi:hypothetical protein